MDNKAILVKFLKENRIFGDFIRNTYHSSNYEMFKYMGSTYENSSLMGLFSHFFVFRNAPYPTNIKETQRFTYWNNFYQKYQNFVKNKKYEKYG